MLIVLKIFTLCHFHPLFFLTFYSKHEIISSFNHGNDNWRCPFRKNGVRSDRFCWPQVVKCGDFRILQYQKWVSIELNKHLWIVKMLRKSKMFVHSSRKLKKQWIYMHFMQGRTQGRKSRGDRYSKI